MALDARFWLALEGVALGQGRYGRDDRLCAATAASGKSDKTNLIFFLSSFFNAVIEAAMVTVRRE